MARLPPIPHHQSMPNLTHSDAKYASQKSANHYQAEPTHAAGAGDAATGFFGTKGAKSVCCWESSASS